MDRLKMIDTLEDNLYRLKNFRCLVDMLCAATDQTHVPADALFSINDLMETICLKFQADIGVVVAAAEAKEDI